MLRSRFILLTASLSLSLLVSHSQQWGEYTLYSVQNSSAASLIDTNGTTYHSWTFSSNAKTGYSTYMMPGGTIVRTVSHQGNSFNGGGSTGQVQKVDWTSNVIWDYVCSTTTYCAHHDIHPMPNGNVLIIAWESKSASQSTQAGSRYSHIMWPDEILEVEPSGTNGGNIVWEWHAWDHLVQDYDASKDNYGVVADHPELLDINYGNSQQTKDWMHVNGIDYNEELDQIVFSSHFLNELYVIDHSTTSAEAAGHTGGNSGKGGDFLYRWGNPVAYDASGTNIFHVVHDAHWVPPGCPNANYLVGFNNNGISNNQSSIDLISPPYDGYNYLHTPGFAYAPSTYTLRHSCNGHTNSEGGSQQLPNGNMLVCVSQAGYIYEVDSNNTLLWSKTISGGTSNARRYTRCYVEGTIPEKPGISQQGDMLVSSSGESYRWFINDNLIPGATAVFIVPQQTGSYQVAITDADGCESGLSEPYYFEMTGITEQQASINIMVYPIPTDGIITLSDKISPDDLVEIMIYDRSGNMVFQSDPSRTLDLSNLGNGIYFLFAHGTKNVIYTAKIIIIR
jgi:hypothetical protein